jgi:hypothetical protein
MKRPDYICQEHLDYLDELRESGATNMFAASPYVERAFGIDRKEAMKILQYWMETFGQEDR